MRWQPKKWSTPKTRGWRQSLIGPGLAQWMPGRSEPWMRLSMRRRWMTPDQFVSALLPPEWDGLFYLERSVDAARLHGIRFDHQVG